MSENVNRDTWFESGLRKEVDSTVNFHAVEEKLFSRIALIKNLGPLSLLKIEETISPDRLQIIEKNLFSGIAQYKEYEEPINDCIKEDHQLSAAQWERLEAKLEEKIHSADSLSSWEQLIYTPQEEPVPGAWEIIEEKLEQQIAGAVPQDLWIQCAKNEEVTAPAVIEKVEELLYERLNGRMESCAWEQILKLEEVLTCNQWDKMERTLFSRLDEAAIEGDALEKQPFWYFINHYLKMIRPAGIISVVMLIAIAGVIGFSSLNSPVDDASTYFYQLQGGSLNTHQLSDKIDQNCSADENGAVTLVNTHGMVELQNGSSIEISRISRKNVQYRVEFSNTNEKGSAKGKVAFLVNPHKKTSNFRVNTSDYQISVKGTYFQVEPDVGGRISTHVLEGMVKISSKSFGDTLLKAGQSIVYDYASNQYRIHDGGPVVQRKEIDRVPDVDELVRYGVITVKTDIAGADVMIDGKHYGVSPVAIRQASGVHHVKISRRGYSTIDTTVMLSQDQTSYELYTVMNQLRKNKSAKKGNDTAPVNSRKEKMESDPGISPETVADQLLASEQIENSETEAIYLQAQKAEFSGKWKLAIELYQQVFNHVGTSKLRREDALFSTGVLKAAHERDLSAAKQVFLTYLAMYPNGSFAGETWLRLAELELENEPEKAIRYYVKFFEMFPHHPRVVEIQNRVGVIYLQLKRYDEAISMFRKALDRSSSFRSRKKVAENLHRALVQKGDRKNADTVYNLYLAGSQ